MFFQNVTRYKNTCATLVTSCPYGSTKLNGGKTFLLKNASYLPQNLYFLPSLCFGEGLGVGYVRLLHHLMQSYRPHDKDRILPMPRKYSPSEKADALAHLHRTGNFPMTALQTGISERTLYTWRQQEFLQQTLQQQKPAPLLQKELPVFEDDLDALAYLRQQIMTELVRLSSNLQDDTGFTTPQQRALILTQLIDRLIKLDEHLKPYEPSEMYRLPNGQLVPFLIDYDVRQVPDEEDQNSSDEDFELESDK
jgi:transposase-like protein